MSNTMKIAPLIDFGPRPVLRRQRNIDMHLVVSEIQRMARGLLARRRASTLRLLRSLPPAPLQRSENVLEPLSLPVVQTPVNMMPSPLSPPPVYRLTREDERRLVTDKDLDDWARNLETEFNTAYP